MVYRKILFDRTYRQRNLTFLAISLFVGALFVSLFSLSTSPLYHNYGWDSVVWQIIGKYWVKDGTLPYVGLWDHKGPFIHFVNCLGYLITGNVTGIFILQILNLSLTFYIFFRTYSLTFNSRQSLLFSVLSLIWLLVSYEEGNLTEEYMLPWISIIVFLVQRWLISEKNLPSISHFDQNIGFWGGVVFGLSAMTRLTNAIPVCGILFFAGCVLLYNKKFMDVLKFVGLFLVGSALIIVPFVIYFASKGALYDMWFSTFAFNFQYGVRSIGLNGKKLILMHHVLNILPIIVLTCLSFYLLFCGRKWRFYALLLILAVVPYLSFLVFSQHYNHYNMVLIPLASFLVYLLHIFLRGDSVFHKSIFSLVLFGSFLSGYSFRSAKESFSFKFSEPEIEKITKVFSANDVDTSSVQLWDLHPRLYLSLDIKPVYAHFFTQSWHSSFCEESYDRILAEERSLNAKFQLVNCSNTKIIQEVLDNNYTLVYSMHVYAWDFDIALYKRNF